MPLFTLITCWLPVDFFSILGSKPKSLYRLGKHLTSEKTDSGLLCVSEPICGSGYSYAYTV